MYEFNRKMLLGGNALHVHKARGIRTGNELSPCGHMAMQLVEAHLGRNASLLNREHSAKATTLIGALRLKDGYAVDQLKEITDLIEFRDVALRRRRKTQFAHSMTAIVKANLMRELRGERLHLHHIMKELHEIHGLSSSLAFMSRYTRMEYLHISRAARRRSHYIVIATKQLVKIRNELIGLSLKSGIAHGLPATCLLFRIIYLKAQATQ